jgi:hypothetical protein
MLKIQCKLHAIGLLCEKFLPRPRKSRPTQSATPTSVVSQIAPPLGQIAPPLIREPPPEDPRAEQPAANLRTHADPF